MDTTNLTVEQFAELCGVSINDARAWLKCIRLWMVKGYTFEKAVERHMAQMTRMTFWAGRLDEDLRRDFAAGLYDDLREVA